MNQIFFLASIATDLGNAAQETAKTFGFNTHHFVAQCISFLIVAALLYKFAYKKILGVLEERRQTIAESLANADKIKLALVNAQTKSQEILTQASVQSNKMIEEARAAAAKVQEVETQKAIATANQIVAKAREASEAELVRMKSELRKELVRLVAETTAKVSGKILTLEDQKRLADETTKQIAA
ncbi:MAG TPA: F0F1 ATP synthase subunit B [Candidatus Acidoferrum sp.]|nr:F0F1 ATP synthase subunit B [Candidatus Acidoferrum sp.]